MDNGFPEIGSCRTERESVSPKITLFGNAIRTTPGWLVSLVAHLSAVLLLAVTTFAPPRIGSKEILSWQQASEEMRLEPIDLASPVDSAVATSPDWSNASEPIPDAGFEMVYDFELEPVADGDQDAFPSSRFDFIARTGNREVGDQSSALAKGAEFYGIRAEGNTFVFIVDRSNSMRGERLAEAKNELMYAVRKLTPDQRFYVIFFAGLTEFMRLNGTPVPEPEPVAATTENLAKLQAWVDRVQIEPWTNPFEAVEFALRLSPDAIFLLSDGEFTDNGRTMRYLKNRNVLKASGEPRRPRVVIHSIAFHSRDGEPALKTIAADSGGTFRFVPPPHVIVRHR